MKIASLFDDARSADRLEIVYKPLYVDDEKSIVGTVSDVDWGMWVELEVTDDESVVTYRVFGSEVKNREKGTVTRNGRLIGHFTGYVNRGEDS